jgi:hypothetical protein
MDKRGHIYELTEEDKESLSKSMNDEPVTADTVELREDVARLEGYLKGRADSDRPHRGKGSNKDLMG